MKKINFMCWNVNGVRAAERKGFLDHIEPGKYDIVALQETKLTNPSQLSDELKNPDGYFSYWHCATERKGYSGTAVYTKREPKTVTSDFGKKKLSEEGRMQQLEFEDFIFLNIYFPNGGRSEERLQYKLDFYKEFLAYIKKLEKKHKKIIFCGDVNTAHHPIDLARPEANEDNSGFMPIEREWLDKFEKAGFVDTFRMFNKEGENYTWWDYKTRARSRNVGWRIDYFWVSKAMKKHVKKAEILSKVMGSDHCPITLEIEI